ncbi:MAG: phosphoribosylglycinamide formyltransferase [Alphaproteobacteria bacterium]|nr:phosphoribosylglycinamide formyltransferase [Alphaproteobacteria bacterium]
MTVKTAILISGRGSNMTALLDAAAQPGFPAEIVAVISNRPDAKGLEKAAEAGIPTAVVDHKAYPDKVHFELALEDALAASGAELVCLAGFMRLLSAEFVNRRLGRIVNIHPSLLPSFKGLEPQKQALDAGVRVSGCTVHFVTPGMDEGPSLLQAVVPVQPGDDAAALSARILAAEHKAYPAALRILADGGVRFEDGRAVFADPGAETALFP